MSYAQIDNKNNVLKDIVPIFISQSSSEIPGIIDVTFDTPIKRVGSIEIRSMELDFIPNNVYVGNDKFTVTTSDDSVVSVTISSGTYTIESFIAELQRLFRLETKTSDMTIIELNDHIELDGTNGPFIPQVNATQYGFGWHEIGLNSNSTTIDTTTIGIRHGADIIKIRTDMENEIKIEATPSGIFDNGNLSIPLGGCYTVEDILDEIDGVILDTNNFSASFDLENFKFTISNTSADVSASLTFVAATEVSRILGFDLPNNTTADLVDGSHSFTSEIINISGPKSLYVKSTIIDEKLQSFAYLNNTLAKSIYECPIDSSLGNVQTNIISQRYKLIFNSDVGATISGLTLRLEEENGRLADMQGIGLSIVLLAYIY
jgi:hypothetical protein